MKGLSPRWCPLISTHTHTHIRWGQSYGHHTLKEKHQMQRNTYSELVMKMLSPNPLALFEGVCVCLCVRVCVYVCVSFVGVGAQD